MLNVWCTLLNCCVNVSCERGVWGHPGIYSDTAQVRSRVVRWTGGGGANLRLSDHESNVLHGGFCFCVCREIVFALSQAGNKYFVPTNSVGPLPLGIYGRPLNNTFDIIALVVEWNVAKWGTPTIPFPCIWGFFLSHPSWLNENCHRWMKTIWPNVRQKSYWKWAEPPAPLLSLKWLLP